MTGLGGRSRMSGRASGSRGAIWYRFGSELKRGRLATRFATRQSAPAADRRQLPAIPGRPQRRLRAQRERFTLQLVTKPGLRVTPGPSATTTRI